MKKLLLITLLFIASTAQAAPEYVFQKGILPEVDNTHYLGSTSPALRWKAIILGTGTSTSANGINITGGCFAINNVCVGGSGTITGSGTALANQVTFWETSTSIAGDVGFVYIAATNTLAVGTSSPQKYGYVGLNTKYFNQYLDMGGADMSGLWIGNWASAGTANVGIDMSDSNCSGADKYFYLDDDNLWACNGSLTVSGGLSTSVGGVNTARFTSGAAVAFNYGTEDNPTYTFSDSTSGTSDTDTGMYRPETNTLGWSTNATEKMRLNSNGKLGIGTTSPYALLSVHAKHTTGVASTTLFAIASSTASATTTLFSVSNTGSTTASNGFNITAGCFALNNVCVGGGTTSYDAWTHPAAGQSATTSLMLFSTGFISKASSTIGDGTGAGGLTVSGNSTTTGSIYSGTQSNTSGFEYNATTDRGSIGGGDVAHVISGVNRNAKFEVHSEGGSDPMGFVVHRHSNNDALSGWFSMFRSRGDHGTPLVVTDGTDLGELTAYGYDGTDYEPAGEIDFDVDGTVSNNVMPGAIRFFTNSGSQTLSEALVIKANGNVGIGSSTPSTRLVVSGTTTSYVFNATSTTATSTFANGINLSAGCFAINNVCVGGAGGITGSGSNTYVTYWNGGSTVTGNANFTYDGSSLVSIGKSVDYGADFDAEDGVIMRTNNVTNQPFINLTYDSAGTTGLADNMFIGHQAGLNAATLTLTDGYGNTSLGYRALAADAYTGTVYGNTVIGSDAMSAKFGATLSTTYRNVAIGYQAMNNADSNTANNTVIGTYAGANVSGTSENVLVGYSVDTSGGNSIGIGSGVSSGSGSSNIFIGGSVSGNGSSNLILGGSQSASGSSNSYIWSG